MPPHTKINPGIRANIRQEWNKEMNRYMKTDMNRSTKEASCHTTNPNSLQGWNSTTTDHRDPPEGPMPITTKTSMSSTN